VIKKRWRLFFEHQPGLPSRIPWVVDFPNFTEAELWHILYSNIDSQYHGQMKVEGGFDGLAMRIAIQRLAESSNSRSFGNARTVDNLSTQISRRQSQRLCQIATSTPQNDPDYLLFTQDDIIGPEPLKARNNSAAMTHLQSLVGIDNVKKYVQSMVRLMQTNYQRELRGIKPRRLPLNQLFVGQPGTGKTTVARLYGSILADLGILSRGDVVLKTPADFIGDCVGKSERLTQNILDASVGKMLVIDEAYMLDPGDPGREQDRFKTGVLDTIVANIQGSPNEDRCIIMVGYEDRITDMFHHANPGLRRRFNINNMCRFENYNISQLDQILSLKMREQDLTCTPEARKVAHDILQRASTRPSFANASEVESCLAQAKANFEARLNSQELEDVLFDDTLQAHDFDKDLDRTKLDCRDLLEGKVQESVIQKFISYQTRFHAAKQRGLDVGFLVPTRFIFKGPPGTGKRTTAQAMGRFFYNIGLLPTDEVLQYSTVDFVGEYVGSTPPKTRKLLAKALGKVVFIDNVDRLGAGHYETEAVNEIVHFLNQRAHDGKIVVILAGGAQRSIIEFNGLSAKTCISLLDRKLRSKGIDIEPTLQSAGIDCHDLKLEMLFEKMQYLSDWRNSHDVDHLANEILGKSLESMGSGNALQGMQVSPASVVACVEGALKERQFRSERGKKRHNNTEGLDSLDPHSHHVLSSLLNKMPDIPNFPNISSDNYFEGSYKFQEPTHAEHALDNIYKMEMISAEHESIKRLPRDGVQDNDDEGDDGSSPREPDTTDEDWRLLKAARKTQQKAQKINNEQVSKFQAQLHDTEKKITEGFNNATNKEDLEIYRINSAKS
ncbi:ATPase AAA-type core, partial [Penicillium expansum]